MKTGVYTKLRIWSGIILYIFVSLHLFSVSNNNNSHNIHTKSALNLGNTSISLTSICQLFFALIFLFSHSNTQNVQYIHIS